MTPDRGRSDKTLATAEGSPSNSHAGPCDTPQQHTSQSYTRNFTNCLGTGGRPTVIRRDQGDRKRSHNVNEPRTALASPLVGVCASGRPTPARVQNESVAA